jgi:co-chaperonin GroES (HSP10)
MNIKPMHKKVLVAQNKNVAKSESGIILDNADSVRESHTGTVLAIGPEVTEVKIDNEVLCDWPKAQVVTIDGAQRVMIDEENIVAVLD